MNIEEENLLNEMTEAEQLEYYIKRYNEMKMDNRKTILRLMTTQCNKKMRDTIVNTLNEDILQIDESLNDIYKYQQELKRN